MDAPYSQVNERTFLRILYEFSASLIQITDLDTLLWHVARQVVGQLGFEDCVIYLLDDETHSLVQLAGIGEKNPHGREIANRLVIPVGRGITGRVAANGKSLLVGEISDKDDYIPDTVEGASELCVPILFEGKVLGVIDSEDPRPGYYTEQHQRFLESIASLLGSKINQLRLTEHVHRAERERAALLEIATMHAMYDERESYFTRLHGILSKLIPFDEMLVGIYDARTNRLDLPYSYRDGQARWDELELPSHESPFSLAAYCLRQDGPLVLREQDITRLVAAGEFADLHEIPQCCLSVPFEISGDRSGLLVASGFDVQRSPCKADLDLLSLIAAGIGDAYEHETSNQARLQAEADLATSESRLRSIIENAPISIVLRAADGHILAAGTEFRRLYGLHPDDIVGDKEIPDLDPEVDRFYRDLDQQVRTRREIVSGELERFEPDGTSQVVVVTNFPILDDSGELTAIGSIGIDVTDQRLTEQQLLQTQRLEVVGQLTGGIAHEFNNLLMAISGGVERAEEIAAGNAALRPVLGVIRRGVERGAGLTRRLSVFSRMQIFDHTRSDANELVDNSAEFVKHALGSGVELVLRPGDELWPVQTDQNFFEHALLNLAINAHDAMPDGGRLLIETRNVTIEAPQSDAGEEALAGDFVKISVSDSGVGMPPEVQAKAFEPFFTTKEVGKGSGLGLSMVFGFVKQSGGHIELHSHPGKGTTVDIYLPRSTAPAVDQPREEPRDQVPGETKARILVVEDDSSIGVLMKHFLGHFGHEAVIVEDGPSAVAFLEQNTRRFDLLITDMSLPFGMDGKQVASAFLEANGGGQVLYMSGYAEDSVIKEGRLDDGHGFLAKPFTRDSLATRIDQLLER